MKAKIIDSYDELSDLKSQLEGVEVVGIAVNSCGSKQPESSLLIGIAGRNIDPVAVDVAALDRGSRNVLQDILTSEAKKVAFDWPYTGTVIVKEGFGVDGQLFDVMLAHQMINAGLPLEKDLCVELVSKMYLTCRESFHGAKGFSVTDAAHKALLLRLELIPHLKDAGLVDIASIEFGCLDATVQMQVEGMAVDQSALEALFQKQSDEAGRLLKLLQKDIPAPINFNSPRQLLEALQKIGVPIESTAGDIIRPLSGEYPVLTNLVSWRRAEKTRKITLNLLKSIDPQTGRIYPKYGQIGAPTGRMSCSKPPLQAVPNVPEYRQCFVVDKGKQLIRADYSQIEVRIAAEISMDERMIKAFCSGADFHRATAGLILDKDLNSVSDQERKQAKCVVFGMLFGMRAKALVTYAKSKFGVEMSLAEAKKMMTSFFNSYKGFARWFEQQSMQSETHTLGGRRRLWKEQPTEPELLNSPIQGTAADILKLALGRLPDALEPYDSFVCAAIHDEILVEVPRGVTAEVSELLQEIMVDAGREYIRHLPVEVCLTTGSSWAI